MGSANPSTPDIQCFQGSPYWDGSQWRCPSTVNNDTSTAVITGKSDQPLNIFSVNSVTSWISNHPYLAIGGIGIIAFLLWSYFKRR